MLLTPSGIVILANAVQPQNAPLLILSTLSGKFMLANESQPENV